MLFHFSQAQTPRKMSRRFKTIQMYLAWLWSKFHDGLQFEHSHQRPCRKRTQISVQFMWTHFSLSKKSRSTFKKCPWKRGRSRSGQKWLLLQRVPKSIIYQSWLRQTCQKSLFKSGGSQVLRLWQGIQNFIQTENSWNDT